MSVIKISQRRANVTKSGFHNGWGAGRLQRLTADKFDLCIYGPLRRDQMRRLDRKRKQLFALYISNRN